MKKRIYLALIVSMVGICGCTPHKDSEQIQDNTVIEEENPDTQGEADTPDNTAGDTESVSSDESDISAGEADEATSSSEDEATASDDNSDSEDAQKSEADSTSEADESDIAGTEESDETAENTDTSKDNAVIPKNPIADSFVLSDDLWHDYEDEIKDAVKKISSSASSLQDELQGIEALENRFSEVAQRSETQADMTQTSYWPYAVWDAEINSLWSRLSDTLKGAEKDNLLSEQRNWIAMKEEVVLETLGPREEGGSIYPTLENDLLSNMTKTRSYYLASVLANATDDTITLPARGIRGAYVDNQGTGEVYSSLIIKEGWESGYDATISIFRLGNVSGTVEGKGTDLIFTSEDGATTGIIRYGWGGASLEITSSGASSILKKGDVYEFKMIF
ncbi:lysozyme inhibitor LprI family protein [Butyrivibrio sp. AE3004]|uniref:lysozyme inhibitor LprI family protein n=1 Tax=Butyrivibrio sp. AE3004 TaxID=1506994 RepID=UPI00068B96B7|nr:lysozyme inhibitor LprI family protein [Butyrivibrio sp. AE3004]